MRSSLSILVVLALLLTGCAAQSVAASTSPSPSSTCAPPPGGRCAGYVPWGGSIMVSPDGRRLHGIVECGGTLEIVSQTAARVVVRLHVDAVGPGAMTCARVDVGAQLDAPLDGRPVYDSVSGQTLNVVSG